MAGTVSAMINTSCGSWVLSISTCRAAAPVSSHVLGRQDGAWLPQHRTTGNHEFDEGSRMHIRQPQFSTKFLRPLFHASYANSDAILFLFDDSLADPFAIVSHGNHDLPFPLRQSNPYPLRFGMPKDIGQSLLDNSKSSGLYLR